MYITLETQHHQIVKTRCSLDVPNICVMQFINNETVYQTVSYIFYHQYFEFQLPSWDYCARRSITSYDVLLIPGECCNVIGIFPALCLTRGFLSIIIPRRNITVSRDIVTTESKLLKRWSFNIFRWDNSDTILLCWNISAVLMPNLV